LVLLPPQRFLSHKLNNLTYNTDRLVGDESSFSIIFQFTAVHTRIEVVNFYVLKILLLPLKARLKTN